LKASISFYVYYLIFICIKLNEAFTFKPITIKSILAAGGDGSNEVEDITTDGYAPTDHDHHDDNDGYGAIDDDQAHQKTAMTNTNDKKKRRSSAGTIRRRSDNPLTRFPTINSNAAKTALCQVRKSKWYKI
jgi:hypothetical protein